MTWVKPKFKRYGMPTAVLDAVGAAVSWALVSIRSTVSRALVFLGRSLLLAGRRIAAREKTTGAPQEDQITERFTRAIEQLGNEKLEVRLSGIYALEQIARDSDKDYWSVREVLTAYIRENAPWQEFPTQASPRFPSDIQAILTVLRRSTRTYGKGEDQSLDLSRTDIQGAVLVGAHLEEADFSKARLGGALLTGAHLEGADLSEAYLERAHLGGACLEKADLTAAHLEGANLRGARLGRALLVGAHLEGANLSGAHLEGAELAAAHLEGANLTGAHLEGADLTAAHLEGATLRGTHLERAELNAAHLTDAVNLTRKQIEQAFTDEKTRLPDYLLQAPESAAQKA